MLPAASVSIEGPPSQRSVLSIAAVQRSAACLCRRRLVLRLPQRSDSDITAGLWNGPSPFAEREAGPGVPLDIAPASLVEPVAVGATRTREVVTARGVTPPYHDGELPYWSSTLHDAKTCGHIICDLPQRSMGTQRTAGVPI